MTVPFMLQAAGLGAVYSMALLATIPFLIYFGEPKPWQKKVQFLMTFPFDNEQFGFFSFGSAIAVIFLNGLLFGIITTGIIRLVLLAI